MVYLYLLYYPRTSVCIVSKFGLHVQKCIFVNCMAKYELLGETICMTVLNSKVIIYVCVQNLLWIWWRNRFRRESSTTGMKLDSSLRNPARKAGQSIAISHHGLVHYGEVPSHMTKSHDHIHIIHSYVHIYSIVLYFHSNFK